MSPRRRQLALVVALLGAVALGVASGVVSWRRSNRPRWTFEVNRERSALARFVGERALAVVEASGTRGELWSIEDGQRLGTYWLFDGRSSHHERLVAWDGTVFTVDPLAQRHELALEPEVLDELRPGPPSSASFSPDLDLVAFVSSSGRVAIRSTPRAHGACSLELAPNDGERDARFSPRGDRFAIDNRPRWGKWSPETFHTSVWTLAKPDTAQVVSGSLVGFDSTGAVITRFSGVKRDVDQIRATSASGEGRVVLWCWARATVVLDAAGERVAWTDGDDGVGKTSEVVVSSLRDGSLVRRFARGATPAWLALSPGGALLAIGSSEGHVEVWELPP